MNTLEKELDATVPGSSARLREKRGNIADVANILSHGIGIRDRGGHAHFVCPECDLDMPSDMIVWMPGRGWLCTGCVDGIARREGVARRDLFAEAGADISALPDIAYFTQPPQQAQTKKGA